MSDKANVFISPFIPITQRMAKKLAVLFGIVFIIVGILGFIPNPIVGPTGLFLTDGLHNIVHFLIGAILLIVAVSAPAKSALWLKIFGFVYLALVVLGFILIPSGGKLLGLVTMNTADHFLHLVLGIVLLIAGYASKPSYSTTTTAAM